MKLIKLPLHLALGISQKAPLLSGAEVDMQRQDSARAPRKLTYKKLLRKHRLEACRRGKSPLRG